MPPSVIEALYTKIVVGLPIRATLQAGVLVVHVVWQNSMIGALLYINNVGTSNSATVTSILLSPISSGRR